MLQLEKSALFLTNYDFAKLLNLFLPPILVCIIGTIIPISKLHGKDYLIYAKCLE